MASASNPNKQVPSFPADDPIHALLRDHRLVRKLARTYLDSSNMAVKKQAAAQLLHAIHAHSRLEESVFYPAVRRVDPNAVARCEEDHLDLDDHLATLQGMSMAEARFEPLMREMLASLMLHMEDEETRLFPELRQSVIDMTPIGLEMQAFEANLIHMQAQLGSRGMQR